MSKELALIAARNERNKKKKKEENKLQLQAPVNAITNTINKTVGKPQNKKTTVNKTATQRTTQTNTLQRSSNVKEMPTFSPNDNRTVKANKKKKSVQTFDVYERGGKYFYEENGKEIPIKKSYLKNALNTNRRGVIGGFDENGNFSETNSRGVPLSQAPKEEARKYKKEARQAARDKAITDAANTIENSRIYKGLKTAGNTATNMGYGALKQGIEGPLDFAQSISDWINNSAEEKAKVALGMRTADEARREREEAERQQSEWTGKSLTDEGLKKAGWNEDLWNQWEDGSAVRRDNTAGQIAQAVGGMMPSIYAGKALGFNNTYNVPLKGLKGAELAKGIGKNVGMSLLSNAGGNAVLGASAYGNAYEEAVNNGATPEQARRYGALSAGTEFATEMITGGIPGLKQTGILDNMADGLIDKATGKVTNKFLKQATAALLKMGYSFAGEGFEEALSDIINPMIKNATYTDGEKINWQDVWRDFFIGGASGLILGGSNDVIEGINLANQQIQELNTMADQRIQQLQQEVQQDPSKAQEATQEIQDIQNYVQAQTNIIQNQAQTQAQESETAQSSTNTQETQNVAQNEQNEGTQESAFNNEIEENKKAEETFRNIKTKEDMDNLISNLKDKVDNIKTGEDLKNTFKEIYDIYKIYNKSNYIYEVVEKDGLYGTRFESEFYNPDIKYKPLNEEIKIQKDNLESWLRAIKDNSEEIIYNNQDKVTPTIGKNIDSLDKVTPITTDDFKNKLHDYIDKETEDIKGKFESKDGHLFRGGREVKYLYRAIDQAEMDSIKNNGYIKSNQSKNIGYEIEQGLTDFKDNYPGFYLPRNADGYIIKIEVKPENGFFYDSDEYAKTPNEIPANQIVEINGEKINTQQETNQNENIPATKENVINEGEKTSGVFSTVAPYYSKQVDDRNYNKVRSDVDSQFTNKALNIASNLGINVEKIQNNVGGYSFDDGKGRVDELSYTYKLKDGTSNEDAKMFGCLLGDLGHETQESVVVGNYTNSNNGNANLEYTLKLNDGSGIIKALKEAGITDYTFNKQTNELQLLLFKDDNGNFNEQKILDQFQKLNQVLGGKISEPTKNYVESELIESEDRQNLYGEWLESNRGTKNRELYSQIEEAYKKVKEFNDKKPKEEQSSFSNENIPDKVQNDVIAEKITNNINNAIKGKDVFEEVEEATGKPIRRGIKTITTATGTTQLVSTMDDSIITYDPQSNESTLNKAREAQKGMTLDEKYQDCLDFINSDKRIKAVDIAKIELTLKELQLKGDAEKFSNLVQYAATLGTTDAQALQMMSVIKKMNPMSQLETLQKLIQKEQSKGNKIYDGVKINQELVKKVLDTQNANGEVNQDQFYEAMEDLKNDIAKQMKSTIIDKANSFRYLAMLGNPKTHIRNAVGNGFMFGLQSFKDVIGTVGEVAYDTTLKATGKEGMQERTKTFKAASKEVREYVNKKVDDFFNKNKMTNKYNESMKGLSGDLESRRNIFSNNNVIGRALNKASSINNSALDKMDNFFSSAMTKKAMKNYLTANGIRTNAQIESNPEMVARALDYALFKGKEATFHQDSKTASIIRNAREQARTGSGYTKAEGLAIDATMAFVSTPVNIAKTAMEYTPIVGLGDLGTQLKNSPKEIRGAVIIDHISKQFAGLSLLCLGMGLAASGKIKGAGEGDKEDKIEKNLGNAQYSIKFGNNTYDLSWISPSAVPLFEGVEIYNKYAKNKDVNVGAMVDTFFGALNPVTDMSVLQSIERTLTSLAYGKNAVQSLGETTFSSYLSQYIPTLSSQFAQWFDTKQRNSNTGSNALEKTFDQIKYKIPATTEFTGVGKWLNKNLTRKSLPEKVDIWGEENKNAENFWQRGFEAFLSPANRKEYKVDSTTKELERLARETDDTAVLPTSKDKSVEINGEEHKLKGKDFVDLQKAYGKTAKKNLDELIKSDSYKKASDAEKKSMVGKLYDYATYKAKENYAKNKDINFDSGDQTSFAMIDAFKIPYEKYVENKVLGNESATEILNKLNEAGFSEIQKGAVMNYYNRAYYVDEEKLYNTLKNSGLSNKQKELIKAKYKKNITDSERERYKRADNMGIDYGLYTNFRSFVSNTKGESRTGGLTKKQKVINWIQKQKLSAKQKQNLYDDYINNQRTFSYYK